MPEALDAPTLLFLAGAAFLSGLVRGFSGFGTAMIFLPIAALALQPVWAILTLIGMDLLGTLPLVRRAARDASGRQLTWLLGLGALFLPLGVYLLTVIAPDTYRYAVCLISLGLVICLLGGLRYRGAPTTPLLATTGAVSGVIGGVSGLAGPPVILLYMASSLQVVAIRANTLIFLLAFDALLVSTFLLTGQFALFPFGLGLALAVPNALGALAGQAIFDPSRAALYRNVAYTVVVIAAITGLPVWD